MKKTIYSFLLLAFVLVAFAVKPVNPTTPTAVNDARVIYNVEGWYETSSGHSSNFQIGSNLRIPAGTTAMSLHITSPVFSSYTFTSTIPGLIKSSSGNYVYLNCSNTPYNTLISTSIDVSGYCPATGQNETFHIVFLPSY